MLTRTLTTTSTLTVGKSMVETIYGLFYGRYEEETNATDYLFSDIDEIQAYIPQINHPRLTFPLIGEILPYY